LVINHSSSQNPWFIESAKGKNSPYRSWYTWAEDSGKSTNQLSATGGAAWHEKNGNHFEATFWEGMPERLES
jgi:alpha-amylase